MSFIEITGARKHNLKNISLRLPKRQLIVFTGISGSGKSSLAYDTIFQEGQRKYLESLSTYARQFIKSIEKPHVESIRGISPTISIDQKHSAYHFNSTVGTISEVMPFLRLLYARIAEPHCWKCRKKIERFSQERINDTIFSKFSGVMVQILAPVVKHRKGNYRALFEKYLKKGFLKALVNGTFHYLDSVPDLDRNRKHRLSIEIDAVEIREANRARIAESVLLALSEGDGEMTVRWGDREHFLSNKLYCPNCDLSLKEPQPGTFSFNSPEGYCPDCQGSGRSDHSRACASCQGSGLNCEALAFCFRDFNIFQLGEMEITDLLSFFEAAQLSATEKEICQAIMPQISQRLESFIKLNLGYMSLNRKMDTLSGGELQRTRLVSQIGFSMSGIIYILDEPSIGMHASEQRNLINILKILKKNRNTVIVVEHDEDTIKASDYIVDLGPGAGEKGGQVVYAGWFDRFSDSLDSLTADYIFKRRQIDVERLARPPQQPSLTIKGISIHNLKNVDLEIPLNCLTVVSGVSGSGKSSLIVDALYPLVRDTLAGVKNENRDLFHTDLRGIEYVRRVLMVNQSAIGKNSRSCPATYIGIMSLIRDFFAALPEARVRGFKANRFSFNVRGGRCEVCQGLGYQTLQMGFLPGLDIVCPVCGGSRYQSETLKVKYKGYDIGGILNLTANEAYEIFAPVPYLAKKIHMLVDVGLGYLRLGQSSVTLSGGESQRIKLTKELSRTIVKSTIYILDEPTVGLHFEDIKNLLKVFQRLVAQGNTVVVIEHNMEVIRAADHVIDLGPGGGKNGGRIIYQGPFDRIVNCPTSVTGSYLKDKFKDGV